jgi:hypothetical protein
MSNIFKKPIIPNIRFEPNNRFSRIFVKTEYSDKTEYSVDRKFVLVIFEKINFYYFHPEITVNKVFLPNIRF